jgi:hypothetical protein
MQLLNFWKHSTLRTRKPTSNHKKLMPSQRLAWSKRTLSLLKKNKLIKSWLQLCLLSKEPNLLSTVSNNQILWNLRVPETLQTPLV